MRPNSSHFHRRGLLAAGAALLGAGVSGPAAAAQPFFQRTKLPIGIQLYAVGPDAAKDLDGTLKTLAGIGYGSVETAGLLGRTPAQFKAALDGAGLICRSAHIQSRGPGSFGDDLGKLAETLNTIGATTAVLPSPYIPDRLEQRPASGEDIGGWLRRVLAQMTADDWKANADFLNAKAEVLKKSGIKVGYHNHNFEFAPLPGGKSGMRILFDETDPALVTFELDVGWVAAAGRDPLAVINAHKGRITMMHVKDIKPDTKPNHALMMDPTEIGSGRIDWKALLAGAYADGVRGFYVEQEPPFARPRLEAAKISHDYLAGVTA